MSGSDNENCCGSKTRIDWILWGSGCLVAAGYALALIMPDMLADIGPLKTFSHSIFELVNTIWWGVAIGVITISILSRVPKEMIVSLLGKGRKFGGLVRATVAGVLLDLCSHGILMVGAKLYERGASTGQVMAFLIASPWNSLSLTLILIALIGIWWTLAFIALSVVIALVSGVIFEILTRTGILPDNPNTIDISADYSAAEDAKTRLKDTQYSPGLFAGMLKDGWMESKMVIRWILFGLVLASVLRAFISPEDFEFLFGPTMTGLLLTLGFATILEVCSEGTVPVAADIINRAGAPGNGFTFLMAGVATDYTEIMVLKDATQTWKIPLFLPLITVPQILLFGYLINVFAVS